MRRRSTRASKSFWSGLSGLLAVVATSITALGGLIAILVQLGVIGGGDGSPSNGGGPTSNTGNKRWVGQANLICVRANDSIDALPDPQEVGDFAGALRLGDQRMEIGQRMLRDLRALEAPEAEAAEVEHFLFLGAEMNKTSEQTLASLRRGDINGAIASINYVSSAEQRFDEAAKKLGATRCAAGRPFVGADFVGIEGT